MADQLYLRITVPPQDGKRRHAARSCRVEVLSSVGGVIGELAGVNDLGLGYPLDGIPTATLSTVSFELVMAENPMVDVSTVGGPTEHVPG